MTFALALVCAGAFAQNASAPTIKWYGFVRNYFAFDTRESSAGTEDLYYYMPKDENIIDGQDLNAIPSFRFAALTSRLGVDVKGYEFEGYKIGAKIETDFYSGVSGVTGTATLRLRQAYATIAKDTRTWKIGQAWHPMAADMPDILSLEIGVPFGPFSRTPQVNFETSLSKSSSLTAAALWQMQYTSTGPDGASANYIKYACTPELYLGYNLKTGKNLFRIGADLLSIKPRNYGYEWTTPLTSVKRTVGDRLTTLNYFIYDEYKGDKWTFKEKVTLSQDGSHMNLVGGYGVASIEDDGSWTYSATQTLSGWFSAQYKGLGKVVPTFFAGYIRTFGTDKEILSKAEVNANMGIVDATKMIAPFWQKNSASSVAQMYRIQPELLYNLGKLQLGIEYMLTAVQYGKADSFMKVTDNLHWISNNRIQAMVKFTF